MRGQDKWSGTGTEREPVGKYYSGDSNEKQSMGDKRSANQGEFPSQPHKKRRIRCTFLIGKMTH